MNKQSRSFHNWKADEVVESVVKGLQRSKVKSDPITVNIILNDKTVQEMNIRQDQLFKSRTI